MKKIMVLCLLLCCFFLAGCGDIIINDSNKTNNKAETKKENQEPKTTKAVLACTSDTKSSVNFNTVMTYYYENDKIVRLTVKYTYDLTSYTSEQRKAFAGSKMCEQEYLIEQLGMKDCKEELSGSSYIVEGDAEKLLKQATTPLDLTKSSFESQGWKCEVK